MAVLRMFAQAREAAGTSSERFDGGTVAEVLDQARAKFGDGFGEVLDISRVWCNGDPATPETVVADGDEVAVLPPVSGG